MAWSQPGLKKIISNCWNQPITGLASRISLALTLLGLVLPLFLMLYVVAFPPRYSINQSIQPTRDHPFSHPFQHEFNSVEEVRLMAVWRQNLRRLRQLEILRLGCGGRRAIEYKGMSRSQFHIDDLFIDSDRKADDYIISKSKIFVLSNSAVRIRRLLAFIKSHQKTLQRLALTRLSLAPALELYSQDWSDIANLCKDAVPGLTYLRVSKLVTGRPKRFDYGHHNDIDAEPRPLGWRSGLADAMSYEWTKGVANGIDQESIVPNVP